MKGWHALILLAAPLLAQAAEVPPELRGGISVEVTSCEPLPDDAPARAVLLRVRAGAASLRQPEVRCGAFVPGTDRMLGWSRVAGLDRLAADATRAVMTLVPADAAHSECRCVAYAAIEAVACAPWEALEDGRCVEPGERAEASEAPPPTRDDVASALRVSRALAPLRSQLAAGPDPRPNPAALCSSVDPTEMRDLVSALVPEDGAVYVRSPWHLLDAADRSAFAHWADQCFGVSRIVDAERGLAIEGSTPSPAQPESAR